jgi:ketosteroid isomerase-like protein
MEIILSCQSREQQKPLTVAIDTAAIKASIDSLGRVVQKSHDLNDGKMLSATWAKDGILVIAGNPPVHGRDAIVSMLTSMPPPPTGATMKLNVLDIQVMSPTWVYVFGVDSLKYTPPGSKVATIETSTFFVVARKTSEGWQSYREILSPNQPQKNAGK